MIKILDNSFFKIVLLAIFLRLLIMPFLFHPDLKTQYYHASFLGDGIVNIYKHVDENKNVLLYKDTFNYPPLTYFSLGSYVYLAKPFLGEGFSRWENQWGEDWFSDSKIFRILFILKVPYLLFDVLIGLLLIKFLDDKDKKYSLLFWFFNPLNLFIIYGIANFDIIICYFSVLSIYFYKQKKYAFSGFSLGVGIALKLFPLLFLPFFVLPFFLKKEFKKLSYFSIGCVSLPLLTFLPFISEIISLNSSGLIGKILETKLIVLGVPVFYIYFPAIILVFCVKVLKKGVDWELVNRFLVYFLLVLFLFTNYHPQWFLWVIPFLTLLIVQRKGMILGVIFLMVGFFIHLLLFEDRFLTTGMLSPIIKNVYNFDYIEQTLFFRYPKNYFFILEKLVLLLGIVILLIVDSKKRMNLYVDRVLNERFLVVTLLLFSAFILVTFFSLAVYYGSKKILIDEQPVSVADLPVYKGQNLQTDINNSRNITQLYIKVKNIALRNKDPFYINLKDIRGLEVKTFYLSGRNIGDNDWVILKFPTISTGSDKVTLTLSSDTVDRDKELRVNINAEKQITFKAYGQRPISETIKSFAIEFYKRFFFDSSFVVVYFMVITLNIVGLVVLKRKQYVT